MKKHWINFLVDGSSMRNRAASMDQLNDKLEHMERQIENLKKDIEFEETESFNVIKKDWTIEEITEAKAKAKTQL